MGLKVEWLINEMLAGDTINHPIYGWSWLGSSGNLRYYFDESWSPIMSDSGDTLGMVYSYEVGDYLGQMDINPDTLVPWSKKK
jgi:hypothetical protein